VIPDAAAFELAPDWVCEVVSPSSQRLDRGPKRRIYARAGVRHLWLLEPIARLLEVLRLEGELWLLASTFEGDGRIRAEPFDAVELDMARWFLPE
jgi:Uma2 family endonuclease